MKHWAESALMKTSKRVVSSDLYGGWGGGPPIQNSTETGSSGWSDTFLLGFGPDVYLYSERTKYNRYRYWYAKHPYVQRAIDLKTNILSAKANFIPASSELSESVAEISHEYFEKLFDTIDIYDLLNKISFEDNLIGEVYLCVERDENNDFTSMVFIPPESVEYGYDSEWGEDAVYFYPDSNIAFDYNIGGGGRGKEYKWDYSMSPEYMRVYNGQPVKFRTHYMPGIDRFVACLFRRQSNLQLPTSTLESIEPILIYQERKRRSRLLLLQRFPTPHYIVSLAGGSDDDMDEFRIQWDMSQTNPDPLILTNYAVELNTMNPSERVMPDTNDEELARRDLMIGLGIPETILTGESTYTGQRITLSVMSDEFRQQAYRITNFINKKILAPIAIERGYVDNKGPVYDKLVYNKIDMKDSTDWFTQLYDLAQQGYISSETLLEQIGIDPKGEQKRITNDIFKSSNGITGAIREAIGSAVADKISNTEEAVDLYLDSTGLNEMLEKQKIWGAKKKDSEPEENTQEFDENTELPPIEEPDFSKPLKNTYKRDVIPITKKVIGEE